MEDGAGAGASINPVAFLVVQNGTARLLPIDHSSCIDRLMDYVPDLMERVNQMFNKKMKTQNEKTEKIVEQIRKNSQKSQTREDFEQKDFEEKQSDPFILKHHISTDVNEDINEEIKKEEPESDGEDL